jgi:hypothetical protein
MCYMSITCICLLYVVICLVLGGVVRVRLYVIYAHLCNHMLLRSGGGTWDTALYTVRGVGSGSRDVDAWRANGPHDEGRGLQVPIGLDHGGVSLGRMTY